MGRHLHAFLMTVLAELLKVTHELAIKRGPIARQEKTQ
jgi:hypothetical protein